MLKIFPPIVKFLKNPKSLKALYISNGGHGVMGTTAMAEALCEGSLNLEVLTISRSRVECDGMKALAKALEKMSNLKEL